MLGELTRKDETHRGLNLAGAHGGLLVVLAKLSGLAGDTSEGVRDEGVEDGHRSLGDAGVRGDLLDKGFTKLGPYKLDFWKIR